MTAQVKPVSASSPKDSTINRLTHQFQLASQDTTRLRLVIQIIHRYRELNQAETKTAYLQQGFQLARRTTSPLLLGRFYAQVGEYYQHLVTYPQVISTFQQAIHYLQQTDQQDEITLTMYRLARAYHYREMMVEAFKQIRQNLAYAHRINFHQHDVANYGLLHTLYVARNEEKQALRTLQTMVAVAKRLRNPSDLYLAYTYWGEWYDLHHQYSKALPYHQKALTGILSQGQVDINYVSQNYYAITNNLFQQHRLSEAQTILSRAIRLNKEAGIAVPGNLFRMQALILERQHRLKEAYQWISKTLPNFRKANPSELVGVLDIVIRIQHKRGHYPEAFGLLKEQKLVNDSLQAIAKYKALANLEAQVELKKETRHVVLLEKNVAFHQLELMHTRQRQLLFGGLALCLLLVAIGGGWAARIARGHVKLLRHQTHQIYQQAQHLQELNSVKDKLFSVIGHDLRSPVLHLRASLKELSQPSIDPHRFERQVNQLNRSVNSIFSTLDNLLHWSALQRNKLVTRPDRVDLAALTEQVLLLFEAMIAQKALVVKLDEGPLWAWVDEIQAQIILRNIIHNACKFTPVGGRITIGYQQSGAASIVRVTDTGVGMHTGSSSEKGAGLGLVVTREFLSLNGGWLTSRSQPIGGTAVELGFLSTKW